MADILFTTVGVRGEVQASAGGQGSFSYADTTVYGNRQDRSAFAGRQWALVGGVWVPSPAGVGSGSPLTPGAGGGAKLPGKRYYGGRAVGFNPNGAVLIRLFKVV